MEPTVQRAESLKKLILEGIRDAQDEKFLVRDLQSPPLQTTHENDFLLFIKPEITAPSETIRLAAILDFLLDKIRQNGLSVGYVKVLSARYLQEFNIIDDHYGVINRMAKHPLQYITETAAQGFASIYGESVQDVNLVGGIELLAMDPQLNPYTLDLLWKQQVFHKLAGGVYCARIEWKQKWIYLVNGFHPRQLQHYTERGNSIVVLSLSGSLNWETARKSFVGATDPGKADPGSIRSELLHRKSGFGLAEINQSFNGVHLSAGPVESLCEHKRFLSDFSDTARIKDYTSFPFGSRLSNVFNESDFQRIIANENVLVNGKSISIFDLTENCDSTQAISLLQEVMPKC